MSRDAMRITPGRLAGRSTREEIIETLLLMREHFRVPLPDSERRHLQEQIETLLCKHGVVSRSENNNAPGGNTR